MCLLVIKWLNEEAYLPIEGYSEILLRKFYHNEKQLNIFDRFIENIMNLALMNLLWKNNLCFEMLEQFLQLNSQCAYFCMHCMLDEYLAFSVIMQWYMLPPRESKILHDTHREITWITKWHQRLFPSHRVNSRTNCAVYIPSQESHILLLI